MCSVKAKIAIVGRVNAGKSTLLNALTGQDVAIVSPQRGTTTDPVRRAYELLDYGAVTFIDTAGIDDNSELGKQRMQKTARAVEESDLVLFVASKSGLDSFENNYINALEQPFIVVYAPYDVEQLLTQIRETLMSEVLMPPPFYGEKLASGDTVLLVCPIDSEAPAGRLILPQVQAIRAALDIHATAVVVQVDEVEAAIERCKPRLVVTDSQAFAEVKPLVSTGVALTSFSILLAHQKALPNVYEQGLKAVDSLKRGDRVLIIEHCSHGVSCEDIGRVKIPNLLSARLGFEVSFDIIAGRDPLPADLTAYSFAVQCGGCMVERTPIVRRIVKCQRAGLPITNYGMLLKQLL